MVASDHGPLFGVFPSIVGASFSWGAQGAAVGAVGGMVDGAWGKPAAKEALKVVGTKVGTHAAMFGAIAAVYGGAERAPRVLHGALQEGRLKERAAAGRSPAYCSKDSIMLSRSVG